MINPKEISDGFSRGALKDTHLTFQGEFARALRGTGVLMDAIDALAQDWASGCVCRSFRKGAAPHTRQRGPEF